ncbi:MAG: Unknown protein [uncultured Sulfurovum sp.]|uniref:Uncharacterized protein n=1 Tax=uncultured Sulfurovum sp. TaxID=269237 RepID=A0A6S6T9U0_9BACT|nr:MAG: Unknown protein [uncultured Sulfurovum sp.]
MMISLKHKRKKVELYKKREEIKEAATYIPNPDRISIIGDGRLDFWVRNGARYNPPSRPTSKKGKIKLFR